jgi:hypothetical protein
MENARFSPRIGNIDRMPLLHDGTKMMKLEEIEKEEPLSAFEREDDWCTTADFYLDKHTDELPAIEPYAARVKELLPNKESSQ